MQYRIKICQNFYVTKPFGLVKPGTNSSKPQKSDAKLHHC